MFPKNSVNLNLQNDLNKLRENLTKLMKFAKEHNFNESFSQICFVESDKIQYASSSDFHKISRKFIYNSENYETRFDELLNK